MPEVTLITEDGHIGVPDCWEAMSPETFLAVAGALVAFGQGRMSPMEVKTEYVRHALQDAGHPVRTQDDLCDAVALAEKVTFPFRIRYDDEQLLSSLPAGERERMHSTDPHRLDTPLARAIARRGGYSYVLNACFCAQLVPAVTIGGETFQGYKVRRDYDMLSTSMTAMQYIDARSLSDRPEALPLMAAVLYCPGDYDPEKAHLLSHRMESLDPVTLAAIQLNFIAFDSFLLTRTHFRILQDRKEGGSRPAPLITTGPVEALYSLASSGYGNLDEVERMNVIKYLTLMRKQLIESVQTMAASGMKITDIAAKSGLPFTTINSILQ